MVLSRGVSAADLAEISSGRPLYPVVAIYLDWPGGAVRMHTSTGTITWGGEAWGGVGKFGSVRVPDESAGLASQPIQVRLVGVPDTLDDYLDDPIRGRDTWVGWGLTTKRGGNVLIGELNKLSAGYMDALRDVVEAVEDGWLRGVILQAISGPSQRAKAKIFHTAEDQARSFPGDTAGRHTINAEAEAGKMTWPE